jgi:hypothetical protein
LLWPRPKLHLRHIPSIVASFHYFSPSQVPRQSKIVHNFHYPRCCYTTKRQR